MLQLAVKWPYSSVEHFPSVCMIRSLNSWPYSQKFSCLGSMGLDYICVSDYINWLIELYNVKLNGYTFMGSNSAFLLK